MLRQVKVFIDESYSGEITLELLSQKAFMSVTYLSQQFKKAFGVGISEYLSDLRLDKARELLRDEQLKVAEIALRVGLSNSTYFITRFKKKYGLTPNQYRQQLQSDRFAANARQESRNTP